MEPTLWIPGENCDAILKHPAHPELPLIFFRRLSDGAGPRVRVHYEVYWPEGSSGQDGQEPVEVRHLWFTAILADSVLCPDGSWYPFEPDEVRSRINAILREKTDIRLTIRTGTIQGLYCQDHAMISTVYPSAQTIEIHLSTRLLTDIPPEPAKSLWLAPAAEMSSRWGTARWQ